MDYFNGRGAKESIFVAIKRKASMKTAQQFIKKRFL